MNWADFVQRHVFDLLALLVALGAAAFINGTEAAMFSLSPGQLYRMRHSGHRASRLVGKLLLLTPRRTLNTLLLGNLLMTTAIAAVTALIVIDLDKNDQHAVAWAASIVPLVALILLGEMAPKMLGYIVPVGWSALAAYPVFLLEKVFAPVLWLLEKTLVNPLTRVLAPRAASRNITSDELASLLDLSARRGIIAHDASQLLQEIVQLTDLRVSDIMVPRVDMIAYDIHDSRDELVELFRSSHLRKIPVYDGQPDRILGVIYGKELLLSQDKPLAEMVTKVPFVPETGNVERLLVQFRVTRKQMAIVVDEFGGVAGLVTLKDIVEEIIGDIPTATDGEALPPVQRLGPKQYLIDGGLPIHDLADALGIDLATARISTVGGFLISLLGRLPKAGDEADYRNLRLTVVSTRRRRIDKLRLELTEGQP